jgi:hypothetical protein
VARRNLVALILCLACGLSPTSGHAFDIDVIAAGVRWRFSGDHVLGKEELEKFSEYSLWASIRLPWQRYGASGWGAGSRLLASAGVLEGADSNALVVSVIPVLAIGSHDNRFNIDLGAGLALLSRSGFGQQEFGGNLQAALTFGVSVPIYRQFGAGYRFMHYSDAGVHGSHTIGTDLHMIELSYRF